METRPPRYTYSFLRVLWFPLRLIIPPENTSAVRIRSFSVIPPLKISLQDVIDGKHLPPLSSMDFEEYLRYQEHSVENLYFMRWLNEYTTRYNAHAASPQADVFNPQLAMSFARAKITFFSSKSPLAINVESKNSTLPSGVHYPHPDTFTGARHEVEHMLRESLTNFITDRAQGNAGYIHLICVTIFGFTCTLSGLAPILVQIYRGEDAGVRSIRLACIAPFWIGLVAFLGAVHGVCPIVWMFGEGRQLRGYELARPQISLPVSHTTMMPQQTRRLPGSEDDLDANHLSQMELGFPGQRPESEPDMMVFTPTDSPTTEKVPALPQPSANQDSRTRERSVTIATAITLDLRNASPTPSSHSQFDKPTSAFNSSSPEIKRSSGGDFQSQPNTSLSALPTTLSSPISPDLASAPMGQVSSSISPFAKYDPAIDPSSSHSRFASTTYDNTASEEAYFANFALPSLGTRPPRRPRCSRTLGTVIADMTPRGPKALVERVRVKILGLRDEDEFSGKDYTRPGPFAPMTPIESAIIRRSNWEVIAKSVIIASILTAVLAGSLYTVPVKHH